MTRFKWSLTVREAYPVVAKPSNVIPSDAKQGREASHETKLVIQQVANDMDGIKCS